jgi:hypothetical protein
VVRSAQQQVALVVVLVLIGAAGCASGKPPEVQRATEGPTAEEIYMARFVVDYARLPTFEESATFRSGLEERVSAYLSRHPELATSMRASQFTFHRRVAVGMTREEVTLLIGAPAATTEEAPVMAETARQFWPAVSRQAKEMWTYAGGWALYFDGDRLVDLTVTGKPPL